jgi:hypothetical protein
MNVPIKLTKMFQTFAENKIDAEENKIQCCICYDDNSEEGNKGKFIECCPNKHILCIECFHKSYERKCECPLCRELMYRPEIMTDVESFAYFGAKLALKQKREREEQQRQFRLAEAERQRLEVERRRLEAERQRQEELAFLPIRKTERRQIIQRRNAELMRQIATNNAEMENINNLGLDAYNALYPEPRTMPPHTIISDSDSDSDDSVELIYGPQPRPERIIVTPGGIAIINQSPRPLQQPVQNPRPVQQPVQNPVAARPVQQPVQNPVVRPVQQPVAPRPVQQPVARPVQQPVAARPVTMQEQIQQLIGRPVQQPSLVHHPVARPTAVFVPRHERPVQERRSSTYAYDKLVHNEILVQTLRGQGMVVRYDRLNDRFIRVSDNSVYPTLNRASAAHALEVGLATTPNAWTTFKRLNGSSIDNL